LFLGVTCPVSRIASISLAAAVRAFTVSSLT
jgi:hypothetical protein